jgi:hypothetical protein
MYLPFGNFNKSFIHCHFQPEVTVYFRFAIANIPKITKLASTANKNQNTHAELFDYSEIFFVHISHDQIVVRSF